MAVVLIMYTDFVPKLDINLLTSSAGHGSYGALKFSRNVCHAFCLSHFSLRFGYQLLRPQVLSLTSPLYSSASSAGLGELRRIQVFNIFIKIVSGPMHVGNCVAESFE